MSQNTILADNLKQALHLAVATLAKAEFNTHGPDFKSCYRAGLEQNLRDWALGEPLVIKDDA